MNDDDPKIVTAGERAYSVIVQVKRFNFSYYTFIHDYCISLLRVCSNSKFDAIYCNMCKLQYMRLYLFVAFMQTQVLAYPQSHAILVTISTIGIFYK